ncbi:lactate racemase domain-containing protein [Chloroflexota bacterium]
MAQTIKLPQKAWYETGELELSLPDGWQVETCQMAGYDKPEMTDDQIRNAITNNLIGLPPIREMARGKKEVVIISNDIDRVTRVFRMIPPVLEELAAAGIKENQIRFITANGNHAAMNREEMVKKLGEDIVSRFPVYNHNSMGSCTYVGTTKRGTRVCINPEVMSCDFKIAIGSLTPHLSVVFGCGSKMLLPGVASIDTIVYNHSIEVPLADKKNYDKHPVHLDMEEAASFVGLDVSIEDFVNLWGNSTDIYAGELYQAHAAGVQAAKAHYLTPLAMNKDIVIANSYAKASESATGAAFTFPSVKEGGDLVLIANTPAGQVVHYLGGPWGKAVETKRRIQMPVPPNVNRLIVYTEYPELPGLEYFEGTANVIMLSKWDDVIKLLRESHGDNASVAVYPSSDIAYFGE